MWNFAITPRVPTTGSTHFIIGGHYSCSQVCSVCGATRVENTETPKYDRRLVKEFLGGSLLMPWQVGNIHFYFYFPMTM